MDCLQLPLIRLGRIVNSAFPNKKNLAQRRSLFMTNKFESECFQKFYVSSKHEYECYMKTTSYLEEPNHLMRRTTQQTFSAINLASQPKSTKLFFSSQVRKQFKLLAVHLSHYPVVCEVISLLIAMFENSTKSKIYTVSQKFAPLLYKSVFQYDWTW